VCVSGSQNNAMRPPQTAPPERVDRFDATGDRRVWSRYVGPTFAEPLLLEDAVLVATQGGLLYCLEDDDREPSVGDSPYEPRTDDRVRWVRQFASPIMHRPLRLGSSIVVGSNDGGITAVDAHDGSTRWTCATGCLQPAAFALFSNMVSDAEHRRLWVGSAASQVLHLDAETGKILWKASTDDWVRAAPWVTPDGLTLAADLTSTVQAFDAKGTRKWATQASEFPILADPGGDGKTRVFADAGLNLIALNPNTGTTQWHQRLMLSGTHRGKQIDTDTLGGGGFHQSSPTIDRGRVYVGTASRFVQARELGSGRLIWRYEMGSAVSGAPLILMGKVYFGQQGGDHAFVCVDAATGNARWTQSLGWVWSSPQIADGVMVVPGVDGHVSGVDPDTGTILWRLRTGGACHPMPASDGRRVVVGSWDGIIYTIDARTGRTLTRISTGGVPDSGAPAIHNARAFFGVMGDHLAVHDLDDGRLIGRYVVPAPGASINVTPSVDERRLVLSYAMHPATNALDARVVAIDPETLDTRWTLPGGGLSSVASTPTHHIFGSSADPWITCIDDGDQSPRIVWRRRIDAFLEESSPAIANGHAAVLSNAGMLHVFA